METIAILNQKGGVGKTTVSLATAYGLAAKGKAVLFIDLDPQQNASSVIGIKGSAPTSLDVLEKRASIDQAAIDTGTITAIPADPNAAQADIRIDGIGKEYRLREAIEAIPAGTYDYCIIDTPPALGILTINALTAADSAIVPAQADIFSLEGIGQLSGTIDAIRRYSNPALTLTGILLTRYNPRTTLSRDIREAAEQAADALETRVFDATIRESVTVKEAQAMKTDIYTYAPRAKVTHDFIAYIDELTGRD